MVSANNHSNSSPPSSVMGSQSRAGRRSSLASGAGGRKGSPTGRPPRNPANRNSPGLLGSRGGGGNQSSAPENDPAWGPSGNSFNPPGFVMPAVGGGGGGGGGIQPPSPQTLPVHNDAARHAAQQLQLQLESKVEREARCTKRRMDLLQRLQQW